MNAVKRIIKYVGGTCDYGLFYSKESNLSLAGFSNSDWAGNADDRKSTTGGCFYVGANLVAWMSKNQILCPCPLQRQNILLLEVVAHSFFG